MDRLIRELKKILSVTIIFFFMSNILNLNFIFADETTKFHNQKQIIAVLNFESKSKEIPQDIADTVSDFLRYELINTGKFEVIERARMEKILAEQKFQQTGCTAAECAIEIGKILNVRKTIYGSVSKLGTNYFITAYVVDIESAKIESSERAKCAGEAELELGSKQIAYKIAGIQLDEKTLKADKKLVIEEEKSQVIPTQQPYYVEPITTGTSWISWTMIGLGTVFGIVGLSAASSDQKKSDDYYNLYLSATNVTDATYYHEQVDYYDGKVATDKTIATSGFIIAGVFLAIEILPGIIESKDKKTSSISKNFRVNLTPQNVKLELVKSF